MFPTIDQLLQYLFNIRLNFPLQTFGFFVAMAFWGAYLVFTWEFKRYEANGKIRAYTREVVIGGSPSILEIVINSILGFLFGFKVFGVLFNYPAFANDPRIYLISTHGNLLMGLIAGAVFATWAYRDRKKKQLANPKVVEEKRSPYQLMGLITFSVGFFGFIGAKLFDIADHFQLFLHDPAGVFFSANGFAYYGGLIFGALTYLYIGHLYGMKQVHLADIGSPGMMLAYGIGRVGCQLSGDGDWGRINPYPEPGWLNWLPDWTWSFKFPHNSINSGLSIPGCTGKYCNQLPHGVYPTSFYESVLCIGMFGLMWAFRRKIKIPGLMFCIYLILNGGERFLVEQIRVNHSFRFLHIVLTQAELIGLLMLTGGITGICILIYKRFKLAKSQYKLSGK